MKKLVLLSLSAIALSLITACAHNGNRPIHSTAVTTETTAMHSSPSASSGVHTGY